uniref:Motile sperm domain containing 2 n=1 Tax=Equus asinus TaxID=9793 RepID=A0A9L0JGI8_EQUAS
MAEHHAQNKARLISETRRRFEAEYVTGGYRVLRVEAGVR